MEVVNHNGKTQGFSKSTWPTFKSRSEKKTVFNVASLMMTQGNKGAESDCVTTYLHEGAVRGRGEGEVGPGAGA